MGRIIHRWKYMEIIETKVQTSPSLEDNRLVKMPKYSKVGHTKICNQTLSSMKFSGNLEIELAKV